MSIRFLRPVGRLAGPLLLSGMLLTGSLGAGCVVRYEGGSLRPPEPLPPPVDFVQVEERLVALREAETDVDVRDRLDAALDLLRSGQTMTPAPQAAVLRYLQRVVAVEERDQPVEAPAVFGEGADGGGESLIGPPIEEEDLGGSEPVEAPLPDPADGAPAALPDRVVPEAELAAGAPGDPVASARTALAAGDAAAALAALEPCPQIGCGEEADALRAEAVDAWVHAERERSGALFVRARAELDPIERRARLDEARGILIALLERFPETSQADDIRRNIETVDKELQGQP